MDTSLKKVSFKLILLRNYLLKVIKHFEHKIVTSKKKKVSELGLPSSKISDVNITLTLALMMSQSVRVISASRLLAPWNWYLSEELKY